jgi:hypothetical protein
MRRSLFSSLSSNAACLLLLSLAADAAPPTRFQVANAGIHQTEDGALAGSAAVFVPGETIFFSCQLTGYQVSPERKIAIRWEFSAVDAAGIPLVETASGKIETELALEDKEWKPKIRQIVLIPPLAESGTYKIKFSAKDELGGGVASIEEPFQVHGHAVEASGSLGIRNFRFYRKEDESAAPLAVAAYRPGDTVWARFEITGYKLGPDNLRDVAYTVTVTGPGGRVLLPPSEPTVERTKSFYLVKYVPCVISLNLQKNLRPDEYTILIKTEDRLGDQTYEGSYTFRVE